MKHSKIFFGFLVLICAAALFLGCPTDPEEEGGETFGVSVTADDGTKYYSLRTGEVVELEASKATTNEWDIAFKRTRLILTNSGDSGTGAGGVWYTGTDNFDTVTLSDKGADGTPYSTDTNKYVWTGMGAAPTAPTPLNVMTFVGYGYGNGASAAVPTLTGSPPYDPARDGAYPVPGAFTSYLYNADQYYDSVPHEGAPVFDPNNKVYIIKHGNGSGYSKIQVTGYSYGGTPTADEFVIKYKKLN
jgi:hypothetical protein